MGGENAEIYRCDTYILNTQNWSFCILVLSPHVKYWNFPNIYTFLYCYLQKSIPLNKKDFGFYLAEFYLVLEQFVIRLLNIYQ